MIYTLHGHKGLSYTRFRTSIDLQLHYCSIHKFCKLKKKCTMKMFIKQISFEKYVNINILKRFLLFQNVFEKTINIIFD